MSETEQAVLTNGVEGSALVSTSNGSCVQHRKNDSGSYECTHSELSESYNSSSGLKTRHDGDNRDPRTGNQGGASVTIVVSTSGDSGTVSSATPTSDGRPNSSSSNHSSRDHTSSSSSLSHDLSQASSFNSSDILLQHLTSDLRLANSDPTLASSSPEAVKDNEVVKQLLEHIVALKMELEELKGENEKLHSVRSTMDDELHTLTENLFEEAYKMVDDAKGNRVVAEKRLADAAGKIDAMETEMSALKNLLTTPESPKANTLPSLHTHKHKRPSVKKALKKISRKVSRTPAKQSHHHGNTMPPLALVEHKNEIKGASLREGQMMPDDFAEFKEWLNGLTTTRNHTYFTKLIEQDVRPCLDFRNKELSEHVMCAARDNHLLMETLSPNEATPTEATPTEVTPTETTPTDGATNSQCALSGCGSVVCTHRLLVGGSEQWHHISKPARDRIAAACDFYMYIGHIEKGIIKLEPTKLYWQVSRLRAMMTMARLSLELPE